jgi:hypothetical protein
VLDNLFLIERSFEQGMKMAWDVPKQGGTWLAMRNIHEERRRGAVCGVHSDRTFDGRSMEHSMVGLS